SGTITVYYGAGKTTKRSFSLRPQTRATIDLKSLTGISGRLAVMVQSNAPIVVSRTTQHGNVDVTASTGVPTLAKTWYMAEGYTSLTFKEELDLFNPGGQAAHVHLVWPQFNGLPPVTHDLTLAPRSRQTLDVNAYVSHASHSTIVTADQPIVAARTMMFGAGDTGAASTPGATQGNTTLYFAEGSTANRFQEYLTILNPDSKQQAKVTAQFYGSTGKLLGAKTVTIDPMHRANIKVNDVVSSSTVSTVLKTNIPVVAERSMYFGPPNSANIGGTMVFGQANPAQGWAFARGTTQPGQSEFELLFNPNQNSSTVEAVYYLDSGRIVRKTFTLAGNSRLNIDVAKLAPLLGHGYHGVVLRSTNGVSFIAEQAIYTNNMANGSATLGVALQ
ncbi:MAG: hypothetical protein ACRDIE_20460, partial [Chloroflexota bacterium]